VLKPLRLLPVEQPHAVAPREGFPVALTAEGKLTPFLQMDPDAGQSDARWAELPRHFWGVVGRPKPGAVPLASFAGEGDAAKKDAAGDREKEQGLIVRQHYGFGRVLFVGLDSTWRWRYRTGDKYHHRFWGQVVRWAAADKPLVAGNAFVRFGTPQPVYRRGEEVEVVARLGEKLGPVKPDLLAGARLVRLPEGPNEKEKVEALVPLARRPAQPRVLGGKVRDLPPGRYAVELVVPELGDKLAGKGGKPLRANFALLPPEGKEMVDLQTRWPLLEDLAVKSGGKVFTPEESGELADLLRNQSVPHVERHEQELYRWWVMLALVVGLLTLEWAGRKLAGLP
jgi:hypothetical protein